MNEITIICTTFHNVKILSLFTMVTSITLSLTTILANILFIIALSRNLNRIKNSMFYKLLFNIGIADLLTGLLIEPMSITIHAKEAFALPISTLEKKFFHSAIFVINGASILTMGQLCIDRMLSIMRTLQYRGFRGVKGYLVLALPWLLSGALIAPYFKVRYIRYLEIYSFVTVISACLSIVAAVIVNQIYLKPPKKNPRIAEGRSFHTVSIQLKSKSTVRKPNAMLRRHSKGVLLEERVNRSFLVMLCMFLVTYLPSTVMTLYMNFCSRCDCVAIHWLRDLTILCIISSALWRPLYFIFRMKRISNEVKNLLACCWSCRSRPKEEVCATRTITSYC